MELLTHSRLKAYRACPRQHQYAYELGVRELKSATPLRYGTLFHRAAEAYWRARQAGADGEARIDAAVAAFDAHRHALDRPYLEESLRVLVVAYAVVWNARDVTVLAVERQFRAPLVARDGRVHPRFVLAGKLDLILRLADGRVAVAEHKCLAGSATIYDHVSGRYERADVLCRRGIAPLVTGLNERGDFVVTRTRPLREAGPRPIVRVTTLGGRTLRVSGNHPVMTFDGWRDAEALRPGAWVATPRHLASGTADAPLSDEAIRLLGYMIGDGCFSNMSFTKTEPAVLVDVLACAAALGEDAVVRHPVRVSAKPARAPYIRFSSCGAVGRLLDEAGFARSTKSAEKTLPLWLGMSDRQLGQLLGALWSTDGCIDTFRGAKLRIIYTSRSRALCVGIQHALQRLGVVSSVRTTSVAYKGTRVPVSTVQVVSREGKRRFLTLAAEGVIPVRRARVAPREAIAFIPESKNGCDEQMQPRVDPNVWWDRVEAVCEDGVEMTYDVEVPEVRTFVVDGIVTHNTSSEDVSPGSDYVTRLAVDGQIDQYLIGARALGYPAEVVVYDIVRKPALRPYVATASPKLKKDGTPRKGQRVADETPEAYGVRVQADVAKHWSDYLRAVELARGAAQVDAYTDDLWAWAERLAADRDAPRNPDSCFRHGPPCPYFFVCSGAARIDDPTRFRAVGAHAELREEDDDGGTDGE